MIARTRSIRATLTALLCLPLALPASAKSSWPGDTPSIGGAIAAKVIGQQCEDVLAAAEIGELDAFLARALREFAHRPGIDTAETKKFDERFVPMLTEDYTKKYRNPAACDAAAAEEARDMLRRVRVTMVSNRSIFPDPTDPNRVPDIGEAISAKVTAEKCAGFLSALQQAQVERHIARIWVELAESQTDADARSIIAQLKSVEADVATGWHPADCTPAARDKAQTTAGLIARATREAPR